MKKRIISLALALSVLLCGNAAAVSDAGIASLFGSSASTQAASDVYEAEKADLSGGANVKTDHDDYSGSGYIDGMKAGSSVTFTVEAFETGDYGVRLRYANGSGADMTINVYVNGLLAKTATLSQTINWDTWDVHLDSLSLTAGENTITYRIEGTNTAIGVLLDKISMSRMYEAENATLFGQMKTANNHTGYSGTSFAAGFENDGDGVTFTVNAPVAGEYSLIIGYANGNDSGRKEASVYVNGTDVFQVGVAAMGSWDLWSEAQVTVNLEAGANTLTLQKDSNDGGHFNLDYITLKQCVWEYVGKVTGYTGNNTSQLTFNCENAKIQVSSIASNMVKIWCEPTGDFDRKYDSFAVVNENIDPQTLSVTDKGTYYEFSTDTIIVRIQKDPMTITYLDKSGNVLLQGDEQSMGWSTDGELTVNNQLQSDEQFWGLGEKMVSYNRRGTETAMWSSDVVGADPDSAMPSTYEEGRWYMANPYFVSSKGYSIYFDNTSRTVFDLGKTSSDSYSFGSYNPNPGGELIYYFTYGPSVKQITKTYTDLIGKSFFAPEWALGNIQAHWGYTQEDVENVAQTYRDKDIPLEMVMTDIDWYQYLCSPTTASTTNFPDMAGMMDTLDSLNVRWGAINDPNITAAGNISEYQEGVSNSYFLQNQSGQTRNVVWSWGSSSGITDFFNPDAQNWWGKLLTNMLDMGSSAFWADMNEPSNYRTDWVFYNEDGKSYGDLSEMKNAYALMHVQTLFNQITQYNEESGTNNRTFLMTRSGFTGTQRYASPWTGDISSGWDSLYQQINLGTSLSISGYNYWGFDIGGFSGSVSNDQYKRWVELSTFIPVHRFHYASGVESKEPWTHDAEDVSRDYINLRYEMMPYMYSLTADNIIGIGIEEGLGDGGTGIPMVRPMVMEYPDDTETYDMDSQYMVGSSLLVAPVYEDSDVKNVYLPEGKWYDYGDGKTVYDGSAYMDYDAPIDTLPLFVKEGAIIPMQPAMEYVGEKPIDEMTLDVYPLTYSGESHFVLYEDDGETTDYQNGDYTTTRYTSTTDYKDNNQENLTFQIGARTGTYTDIDDRDYLMQFHNSSMTNLSVTLDGTALTAYSSLEELEAANSGYYSDADSRICYVKAHDTAQAMTVVLSGSAVNTSNLTEAETGTLSGNATLGTTLSGFTGTGYVSGLSSNGAGVTLDSVNVTDDGNYALQIVYANAGSTDASLSLSVNGKAAQQVSFPSTGGSWNMKTVIVNLRAGNNTISLSYGSSGSGGINADSFTIGNSPIVLSDESNQTLYAANATLNGDAVLGTDVATDSGKGFAKNLVTSGSGVVFDKVTVLEDGTYAVKIKYGNGSGGDQTLMVSANGDTAGAQTVTFPSALKDKWSNWNYVTVNLSLKAGDNTIAIYCGASTTGGPNIEYINYKITPSTKTQMTSMLTNPGFETGNADGWTYAYDSSGGSGHGIDSPDAYMGNYKFYFYSPPSKQSLSQTVSGLADGTYEVSAWIKVSNTEPNEVKMILSDYDGDATTSVDCSGEYQQYTLTAQVKDGTLTIEFYVDTNDGSSIQIDDVQLWKVDTPTDGNYTNYLAEKLTEYSALSRNAYTQASYSALEAAMQTASRVLADSTASSGTVYSALSLLTSAADALETSVLRGDVTGDGRVTVADVVELRGIIMAGDPSSQELAAGDMDGNGALTVSDVVDLRDYIMKGV